MKLTSDQARALASLRKTHGAGTGRPRKKNRCPCGAMTARRAKARGHHCA